MLLIIFADINFLRFSAVFQENMQDGWLKLQWNVHYIILIEVQVFHWTVIVAVFSVACKNSGLDFVQP
jgi:hypothetical protein